MQALRQLDHEADACEVGGFVVVRVRGHGKSMA
jgi:hypothetical protein